MNSPQTPRLLVVDDNRANRLILERGLSPHGFDITEADGGEEALRLLAPTLERSADAPLGPDDFDLVLLDIMMPDIDGTEVLQKIREQRSRAGLPVIMATAMDSPEDVVAALQNGANDYIPKPINLPVVLARIQTHLSLRSTHRALKDAQRSLIRSAKLESVGFLAAGVAHEIRNPLARINLALPSLERNEAIKENEKLARSVATIKESLARADEVVKGLMKFSRDESLDLQNADVHPLIVQTISMLDQELNTANIEITTDFTQDLPAALVAPPEFTQVLLSIILNAIQAMQGEEGTVSVRTFLDTATNLPADEGSRSGNRLREGEEIIAIQISDTGPGLSPDALLRIFDAFYTTKPADAATGLGLTVARENIRLHGGLLKVANREDRSGLQVTISLRKAGGFMTTV